MPKWLIDYRPAARPRAVEGRAESRTSINMIMAAFNNPNYLRALMGHLQRGRCHRPRAAPDRPASVGPLCFALAAARRTDMPSRQFVAKIRKIEVLILRYLSFSGVRLVSGALGINAKKYLFGKFVCAMCIAT